MRDNPLQFAVVREDPRIELAVHARRPFRRALLIGSGGCTALALAARLPGTRITLVDPNPSQLAHIRAKVAALARPGRASRLAAFNVGDDDPAGLSECGNFESLFRGWRGLLHDLVAPRGEMLGWFDAPGGPARGLRRLRSSPWWPVSFALYFSDAMLGTMFGPDATQHAPPGSYPGYFQCQLERGLQRPDAVSNPFLHHLLLGHYLDRPGCLPDFLDQPPVAFAASEIPSFLDEGVALAPYDFIGLSNIMDWLAPAAVDALLDRVCAQTRPGAVVLWRQLNNRRDLASRLASAFTFDTAFEAHLLETDRSLFYSSVHVGFR